MPYLPELIQCATGTHLVPVDQTIMQNNQLWCKPCWNERFKRCPGPGCFKVIAIMWHTCSDRCAARLHQKEQSNGV